MASPKIIIADNDINYIAPIQLKFIEEFFDKIQLEVITDKNYYDEFFSNPRNVDMLIVSEDFYDSSVKKHNISHVFVMTEEIEEENTAELTVNKIYKYTSIKEIFNEISGKSNDILNVFVEKKKEPEIILVYSANGGSGKTTISTGVCSCLTRNYKRVLYINASYIHTFQRLLDNSVPISSSEVYSSLIKGGKTIYKEIRHVIRKENFYYLPPFKTSLLSLGLSYSLYGEIASEAKESNDYDFIVVDADSKYDEDTAGLLNLASKVIIVTNQNEASIFSTNVLISNLNGINSDKYIFICNDFSNERDNALVSPNIKPNFTVSEYVEHLEHYDKVRIKDLEKVSGIQKVTFLLI